MEAVLSLSMKMLLLFYQIRYLQAIVIVLDFRNAKQQMESMGEQPVSSKTFIAVFQIMQKSNIRVSRQIDF